MVIALVCIFVSVPTSASERCTRQDRPVRYEIARQDVATALRAFARASGVGLLYSQDMIGSAKGRRLRGAHRPRSAIRILLRGTGLRGRINSECVLVISRIEEASDATGAQMRVSGNKSRLFASGSMAAAALASASASAQDQTDQVAVSQEPIATEAKEPIIVTGSRIIRENANSTMPLQVLTTEDIEEGGTNQIGEILAGLPGVRGDFTPVNTVFDAQNAGLSAVELRRLGSNRTLTLIDGRRAVSNSGNGERVDLNTIPAGFVKRVEVTTGGASAIYGTDAIAGVVNLIMEDDFDGLNLDVRYGQPEASGGEEFTVSGMFGTRFANDRAYFLAGIDYFTHDSIRADASRPQTIANIEWSRPNQSRLDGRADDPTAFGSELGFGNCDNSGRFCINPSGSRFTPGGIFEFDDAWNVDGVWFNDQSLLPDDGRLGAFGHETDVDGHNFRPGLAIYPEIEKINTAFLFNYDLSPDVMFKAQLYYSNIETTVESRPIATQARDRIGLNGELGFVNVYLADNPFIPPEVEETRSGTVDWIRSFDEIGRRERYNERETVRSMIGFEGVFENGWNWDIGVTFGSYEQTQISRNELNLINLRFALRTETVNGQVVCEDPDARADGCVPINLFGTGTITPEMAAYVRHDAVLRQDRQQYTVGGSVSGDLFALPWSGPVKAAVGFEYREEHQDSVGDPLGRLGFTTDPSIADFTGNIDVIEVFGEVDVPLVEDMLSLQLAARFSEYSHVGGVFAYNIGGSFQPIPDLRFRAQYSRSQRAPTLTEFFSPPRPSFGNIDDPCEGLLADGSGITVPSRSTATAATIAANCLAEPGIQAFFNNPNNAGDAFNGSGQVFAPNVGNQALKEEDAETFTAGVVLRPRFVPGLALIADYYNIVIQDSISSIGGQLTLDLCYGDTDFPNNRFCDNVTRNPGTGGISELLSQVENVNEAKAEGFDISLLYDAEPQFIPGRVKVDFRYSHYLTDEFSFLALDGFDKFEFQGSIGRPEDEFRARLGYEIGPLYASWTTNFTGGGADSVFDDPTDDDYFETGSFMTHDLYARYKVRSDGKLWLYGGVRNVFDSYGVLTPTGLNNGSVFNITSNVNDLEGREFYLGLRAGF